MSLKRRKSSAVGTLSVPNMLSHHTSPSSFKDMPALPPPLPVHDQLKNISQYRALPPPQCRQLPRQSGGWVDCVHVSAEQTFAPHSYATQRFPVGRHPDNYVEL